MAKPHVLMLATTVPAESGDGTPSFVLDLAIALTSAFDVTILAPRLPNSLPYAEINGVTVRRFPYFFRRWEGLASDAIMPTLRREPWRWLEVAPLFASMVRSALREVRSTQIDVINAHWIIPAGVVATIVNRLYDIPFVVTAHGADVYTLRGWIAQRVKKRVLTRASAVLPVSREIADRLREILGSGDNITDPIPMGVRNVEPLDLTRDSETFLIVGRLAEKKGVHVALEALALTERERLRIIGDGPDSDELTRLANRLQIEDRVAFLGRQTRDIVLREMRTCTALLIPSIEARDGDRDGTPVVLAEAMSCGSPVIASRIAGLADYVLDGQTGYLIPPGDPNALATAMTTLASSRVAAATMGDQARAGFGDGPLSMDSTSREYEHAIRSVVP